MSELVIEEVSGARRTLVLRGGGLPLQGAEWGGGQTIETVWNPGSNVAVQHVFGPTELPSEWEGEWNTTRLVSSPPTWSDATGDHTIVRADDMFDIVDQLRRAGQLLRVVWAAKPDRRIGRYGRISKFSGKFLRADDLTWSITLDWIGRVDATVAVVNSDQTLALALALQQAATDAASYIESSDIITANKRHPKSATTFSLGQLEALVNTPVAITRQFAQVARGVANRVGKFGDVIQKVRGMPSEIVEQFADVATESIGVATRFADDMSRESYESMTTRNTLRNLLTAASYFNGARTQADIMAEAAMNAARAQQARRTARDRAGSQGTTLTGPGDVIKTIVPRVGETVFTISMKTYQEDLSYQLNRINGLPGYTIFPPRRAFILPTREVLDSVPVAR